MKSRCSFVSQLIKAEDTGGLFSTATVNIMVTDINDKNPEFVGLPYEFSVKEGEARKLIGRVHAEDADEGANAEITYFAPDDIPFTVDPETGDVLTKIVLDYEQNDVSDSCLFPRFRKLSASASACIITLKFPRCLRFEKEENTGSQCKFLINFCWI